MPRFATPTTWDANFPSNSAGLACPASTGLACPASAGLACPAPEETQEGDDQDSASEALTEFLRGLGKGGTFLGTLLHELMSGDYDEDLKNGASQATPLHVLVEERDRSNCLGELGTQLRELTRTLSTVTGVVRAGAEQTPPPSLRALVRQVSDPANAGAGDAEAREHAWKEAQKLRRKFVRLEAVATPSVAALQNVWQKSGPVRNFNATLKESHRLFLVSGDLAFEGNKAPWASLSSKPSAMKPLLEFVAGAALGPADFVVVFDGRQREIRRTIEDTLASRDHACEAWIVYAGRTERTKADSEADFTRTRHVVLGARNKEVGFIYLPVPATRLRCKDRSAFNTCGESTTHHGSYTGVEMRRTKNLPRISPADKGCVFAESQGSAMQPDSWQGAVPLFWQESKSVAFFQTLFSDLDVGAVMDLTPGSGAAAEACLQMGAQYLGVCRNAAHQTWLANVLDRRVIHYIATAESGAAVYVETLKSKIEEHFAEVIEQGLDDGEESEEESDDGGA